MKDGLQVCSLDKVVDMTEFSEIMGLSLMTASRSLSDLYQARLVTYESGGETGRSKRYMRIPDPEYFRKGREYFRSPVRRVVYMKKAPPRALASGSDALAHISMLNPPEYLVRTMGKESLGRIVAGDETKKCKRSSGSYERY